MSAADAPALKVHEADPFVGVGSRFDGLAVPADQSSHTTL
jgi:hypothetical protein